MRLHKGCINSEAQAIFLRSVGDAFTSVLGNVLLEVLEGACTLVSSNWRAD